MRIVAQILFFAAVAAPQGALRTKKEKKYLRPGTDHVIWGPMRGLNRISWEKDKIHRYKHSHRHCDFMKESAKGPILWKSTGQFKPWLDSLFEQKNHAKNHSRIITLETLQELELSGNFQIIYLMAYASTFLRHSHCFFSFLDHPRISRLSTITGILNFLPFQNFYILNHFWILAFSTIPFRIIKIFHSEQVQNLNILDHSRISTFWTIPEFLCFRPFHNFNVLQLCKFINSWPFLIFKKILIFLVLNHSGIKYI